MWDYDKSLSSKWNVCEETGKFRYIKNSIPFLMTNLDFSCKGFLTNECYSAWIIIHGNCGLILDQSQLIGPFRQSVFFRALTHHPPECLEPRSIKTRWRMIRVIAQAVSKININTCIWDALKSITPNISLIKSVR